MKKINLYISVLLVSFMSLTACSDKKETVAPELDSSQFALITDVVPDAILEIRYFSTYNFIGTRIPGYKEPVAILTRQAADSLRAVSDDLV